MKDQPVCIWDGQPVPIPASGFVLTVVELAQIDCAPLPAPVPPLKHVVELVQLQPLAPTPRGCSRLAAVWLVRRIDD